MVSFNPSVKNIEEPARRDGLSDRRYEESVGCLLSGSLLFRRKSIYWDLAAPSSQTPMIYHGAI
jgi:hypothetical protein